MRIVKSERLKKLEGELNDLEQWLKLGFVPKKDIEKHRNEIVAIRQKIEEEKGRLQFLKESGEAEDYVAPKRSHSRAGLTDMPTLPDIDVPETAPGFTTEAGFEMESETTLSGSSRDTIDEEEEEEGEEAKEAEADAEEEEEEEEQDEESYFSDRNRWRRGGIVDPDANEW